MISIKKITVLIITLLILVGCSSNRHESLTVESSDYLSGSGLSESTASLNSLHASESSSSSIKSEQEISESTSNLTGPEQEISESDDESVTPAPIGKPDNFTELPPDRTKTLPFSENEIKEIDFHTIPPKYGVITTTNKNVIKEIINFINGLQISDSAWAGTQKPELLVRFHLQDGTDTEAYLIDKGININNKLYSVVNSEKYSQFENMLDGFVPQSYVDKGLSSIKGTVNSSEKTEQYTYLYELNTDSGLKAIQVTQGVNDILQINWQANYPLEENQTVLVFYEKESNPIVPEAILLY